MSRPDLSGGGRIRLGEKPTAGNRYTALRLGVGHYASRYLQRHVLPTAGLAVTATSG